MAKGAAEEAEEHGFDPKQARQTALDHLKKYPKYYSEMEKAQKKFTQS